MSECQNRSRCKDVMTQDVMTQNGTGVVGLPRERTRRRRFDTPIGQGSNRDTGMLSARDAIGLLLDREVAKLAVVVAVGWWMIWTGVGSTNWIEFSGVVRGLDDLLSMLAVLVGAILAFVGTLALVVKLVYDAVVLANAS